MLQSRSTELDKLSRQMGERNQQIRAFERDLATKEDTIHRLRARLEEIQVTNDQVREDRRCGLRGSRATIGLLLQNIAIN